MDCETFHKMCDADPGRRESYYLAHERSCEQCARYARAARRLDSVLGRALRIPVPASAEAPRGAFGRAPARVALAATAALAAVVAAWFVQGEHRGRMLADDVVAHVLAEPQALDPSNAPLPAGAVARVLAVRRVDLRAGIGAVVYATTCTFRGRQVPHLVVRTAEGLVTLLVLPQEHVPWPVGIAASGMRGRVLPRAGGAVAVMAEADVPVGTRDRVAAAVLGEV